MTDQTKRHELVDLTKQLIGLTVVENALKKTDDVIYLTDSGLFPEDVIFAGKIERWESLADSVLIAEDGQPDSETIAAFEEAGFRVGPGETDSFGWLTGVVSQGRLKLVFG